MTIYRANFIRSSLGTVVLSLVLSACASVSTVTRSEYSAVELLGFIRGVGRNINSARGRVSAKVSSREGGGQFQASVLARSGGYLQLDINNPLGGTQAIVKVDRKKYEVQDLAEKDQPPLVGVEDWNGVPLEWAGDLFLGRIPCPLDSVDLRLEFGKGNELIAIIKDLKNGWDQKFIYQFRQWNQHPWPFSLKWIQEGPKKSQVDFFFDSPEKGTDSPEKWEAQSSRGELKVKWRSREISRD